MGDADVGDLAMLCHVHCLLFFDNRIIRKLIASNSSALFNQTDDALCIRCNQGDLIQCVFDEIVFFHIITP